MKVRRQGFTLIEVSLFLAITALLFFGVTLGVRGSIFQQRYNDSVQNFAEFLRSTYSEVTNVEHTGTGTSDQAIYGKILSFGESYDLAGNNINENKVFSYVVVGNIGDNCSSGGGNGCNVLQILQSLGANIVKDGELVGIPREYTLKWGAGLQTTATYSGAYVPFSGMVLIVRHPETGTVYTFFNENKMEVNHMLKTGAPISLSLVNNAGVSNNWVQQEIDFCINPFGDAESSTRRDVRIIKNAQNASGVEIMSQDGAENKCE